MQREPPQPRLQRIAQRGRLRPDVRKLAPIRQVLNGSSVSKPWSNNGDDSEPVGAARPQRRVHLFVTFIQARKVIGSARRHTIVHAMPSTIAKRDRRRVDGLDRIEDSLAANQRPALMPVTNLLQNGIVEPVGRYRMLRRGRPCEILQQATG